MPRFTLSCSLLRAAVPPSVSSQFVPCCIAKTTSTRSFSHLPTLRPTLQAQTPTNVFRPPTLISRSPLAPTTATGTTTEAAADVVPQSSISSHPAFGALQIRCGPRPTMSGHSRLIQKRRHGFLSRANTKNGLKTLKRRRAKGRKRLAA